MSSAAVTNAVSTPSVLSSLLSQLKTDALVDVSGALNTGLTNIQSNPTPQNAAAQGAIMIASILFSGPALDQAAITQAASAAKALLASIKLS